VAAVIQVKTHAIGRGVERTRQHRALLRWAGAWGCRAAGLALCVDAACRLCRV